MTRSRRMRALIVAPALLAGCATLPPQSGFRDVQQLVSTRLPQQLRWNQDSAADREAARAVAALLQKPLTADAAVQVALLNNPTLQAQYERLGIAQADLVQAGLLRNPVFTAQVLSSSAGTETTFGVVQDFVGLITRAPSRRIAGAEYERVKLDVADRVVAFAAEVKKAYYTVQADAQTLELDRQIVSATQAAAELSFRQYRAGNTSLRDQQLQQAFYAQAALDLARAQTTYQRDRERLTRLLGVFGAQTQWTLPARLPDPPARVPALDRLEALAVAQRYDLAAAKKDSEALAYALGYTRRYRLLGPFAFGYSIQKTPDLSTLRGPEVELGLPLFDRGQARVARLESAYRASERRVQALAIDVRSRLRQTRDEVVSAQAQAEHYRNVLLPLRERILQQTERFYNGMLLGVYDLLRDKQSEIDTARAYVHSLRDYWLARADLERALGGALPVNSETQP